jgi:hypothetical protein
MAKQKTPQQIAEEQVSAEEAARREERISAIVAEEEKHREAERQKVEALEARKKAAAEAERLVEERRPLEEALQAKIAEISSTVDELASLHDSHRKALRESLDPEYNVRVHDGISLGVAPEWTRSIQDVRDTARSYLEGSLPALYPKAKAPVGTLAEADPLTPLDAEDQAGRPAGDFPWERLEETKHELAEKDAAERERRRLNDGYKKLEAVAARRSKMAADYGRGVGWNEAVVGEERAWLYDTFTREEIDQMWARVVGEEEPRLQGGSSAVSSDMVSGGAA